jgi:ATP-binding cassette subfamily F protein 3
MLGSFLFRGDDVEKKVKVLSGGERNRLALCKMLLSPFNVLIMDEPTNHLDIASKNILKRALKQFDGTLILVSHDRDFLQDLAHNVYSFRDGGIKGYLGDINYFVEQHELEDMRAVEMRSKEKSKPEERASGKQKHSDLKQKKKLQNKLSKLEAEISVLENDMINDDAKIAENFQAVEDDREFFKKYQARKDKVESLMALWETVHQELENI